MSDDDWGDEPTSSSSAGAVSSYRQDDDEDQGFSQGSRDGGGDRRGRGGRGRGGGGRGRGGYRDSRNQDQNGFGGGEDGVDGEGDAGRRGRGGGRGGRGRGGGRGGGFSRDKGAEDGGVEQNGSLEDGEIGAEPAPPERYIPPELPEGEELFEERNQIYQGSGIHFDDYENIPVNIRGADTPSTVTTFADTGLRKHILDNLAKCNYTKPTPIQRNALPILMAGKDVMACAQTGSGKTAGFLLPILNKLLSEDISPAYQSPVTPEALILAPTRELATQIWREACMYGNGSIVKSRVVYGGTVISAQKSQLMSGCNILVATPGRLKHFISDGSVSLEKVQFFILDEADRMLDMGFMPDIQQIVESLPPKEQRVSGMFSATFPDPIQRAAEAFLKEHVFVSIGVVGGACKDVQQTFIECERNEKRDKLMEILGEVGTEDKVLIFCASKKGADFLATFLSNKNVSSTSIHGDRLQRQREEAIREFTNGTRKILVATAVAARGLDIPKVSVVINYDLPADIDEYVHRIGRTGRVGHNGKAISFFDANQDSALLGPLLTILRGAGQDIPDFMQGGGGAMNGGDDLGFASDVRDGGGAPKPAEDDDEDW